MAGTDVLSGGVQGATSGAMIGGSVGGPIGAVVGGVVGAIGGGLLGGLKKKYKAPARASGSVYGYDAYGNLVNKGTYSYNPATGQYELKAGQLSGEEKAMRANLAGNIANLINTVGYTPDAFVRYAKELSDTYYRQGERKLTEQYQKAQAKLDENLARRGMSTSRAAADITGELQGQRMDTLADIYDAAQRYGYDVESGLQGQARSALSTLAGYQGQLQSVDQSYLAQALNAQQAGQAYENAKAGAANQNIAMQNASVDNMLGAIGQLGSVAGYAWGAKAAQPAAATATPSWMQQGNALAAGQSGLPTLADYMGVPAVPTIQEAAGQGYGSMGLSRMLSGKGIYL